MMYLLIFSIIVNFSYYFIKNTKALHMLQQNWYDDDYRYLKWIISNPKKVFLSFDLFFIVFILFMFIDENLSMILFSIFYAICIRNFLQNKKQEQLKKPLAVTKRVKRLMITSSIIYLIPALIIILWFDTSLIPYYYLVLGAISYLNYFVVMFSNIVNIPVEKSVFRHFYKQAYKKINDMHNLKVVGITGSYGKTSSKNILNDILSVKFNTCPSPKNFNTTNGLMITINNHLDKFNDVFIAEMGAFKKGEIKELCDLVNPKYGILTKIGTAHMDSFGSQENIQKGKFELIESLPEDGVAVLNKDDELQVSYDLKNKCKVIWIGIDNEADVMATNIKQSSKGMTFDCIFKGDKNKYKFETRLLGKANIYNILAGIALGHYFGIEIEQLMFGVKKVRSIEHRLELKKYGDINIIDDAYNSNPVGSKMAVEVLGLMPGKKIIVTPGMIELGEQQYELNMKFGEYISEVCDEVILVGETQTKPIYDGLMNKKYNKDNIHIINDVKVAFKLMQELKGKETYVLLENDLPDIFNEK
ncbi:MAG: UDP-N-acetylmuramoyl-tripeptide--D-alanyl-D-alanine ligase [Firmicutes bacterium]|nr:UDP-N-acetylmuramoyl-tripeptide--D-alanyl-D-alanine ligase [Bacillota bacterium]